MNFHHPVFFRHGSLSTPFNQSLNDMVRSARRWANDVSGSSVSETDVIPQITSTVEEVKRLVKQSYGGSIDINKVWSSPLFPLWTSVIRYNECPSRVPISFTYGISHRHDVKLYRLDGIQAIGWVEFTAKWNVDGVSLDTRDHEGSPVMIIRQSTIDDSFPYNWSEQRVQDELCSQIFRALQDKVALYHASTVVVKDHKSQTPFVPSGDKTPPSFLGDYVKRDTFDAFKASIESSVAGNTSDIAQAKQDIENLKATGIDDMKNQVAVNTQGIFTLNTQVDYNASLIGGLQTKVNENSDSITHLKADVDGSKLVTDSIRNEFSGIRSEQTEIKQDIENLKTSHLNPDDFVTKSSFWSTVEQMPTTQGMRQEIREAVDGVTSDVEASYVKKTEVAELKKLQEQLGKVDVSSFATRSQLAQQQQSIEGWSNGRFELKGAAGNLINDAKRTITNETDTKVNGLSGRINAAVNETNELRKSTRQNLDSLSSTVSAQDTRITNGLTNLKTELQNSIDRKMPNLSASDGMLVVADNAVAEKWKASHYSLSVDNLIKEREEGFILNGTGRMTDGTGRGGFEYSTFAFNGSSGSFSVPANQTSERNIFFTDRIKLKERVFKVSMDVRQSRIGTSKFRLNIRWFTRSGVELNNYLRKEQEVNVAPRTISEWVIAPSDAEFCEVGVVNGTGNPVQLFTNIKVQFASDIPEEVLWQFILGEQYRHPKFAETPIWINCYVLTHNTINVQGIINRNELVPVGAPFIGGTALPAPLNTPYFNLSSAYGGLNMVQDGSSGLKLEARFNSVPPQGLRLGSSFKPLIDIRHHQFNQYAQGSIAKRPMVGLNNNGTTGYNV